MTSHVSVVAQTACEPYEWLDGLKSGTCMACPPCRDNYACNEQTGLCPNGCPDWYYPTDECTTYIPSKKLHVADILVCFVQLGGVHLS